MTVPLRAPWARKKTLASGGLRFLSAFRGRRSIVCLASWSPRTSSLFLLSGEPIMPTIIQCSNKQCGKVYRAKDEIAGRAQKCPRCGSMMEVIGSTTPDQVALPKTQDEGRTAPKVHLCPHCGSEVR